MKFLIYVLLLTSQLFGANMPIFNQQKDIGQINLPGKASYNADKDQYEITGSGENLWFGTDAFYFTYTQTDNDAVLETKIEFVGPGQHEHRKAGVMFRNSLDADAPYVDAVVHGDGLISMQYRETPGADTKEIAAPFKSTDVTVRLIRNGSVFAFEVSKNGTDFIPIGSLQVEMDENLYCGLLVCSHDSTTSETALFNNTKFKELGKFKADERIVQSTLEIFDMETKTRSKLYQAPIHFEAPNWSLDGKYLIYNSNGKLYKKMLDDSEPELIDTDFAVHCNNDHGISPDGTEMVISHHDESGKSIIYTLPIEGGKPTQITPNGPSYWHGWSPDGKTLAYCAERNGQYDIYTIPVTGGEETQLTNTPGLDDGPDYSPDGKYIYFNSVRTGNMRIWRMKSDGSEQTQITFDEQYGDWFAHPSPDGKWLVMVSYDSSVEGHPPNKNVALRLMSTDGGDAIVLTELFGGQGTINVPSWSPDSKKFAFVSYSLVGKK